MLYLGQILQQSFLMFPLVLGLYFSFNVLKIADLTVDGSFVLGAAVFARLVTMGLPVSLAIFIGMIAGALSGLAVGLIQRKNRIDPLIAGILMSFILSSLSLIIMQRPNIGLIALIRPKSSLMSFMELGILVLAMMALSAILLTSKLGLWLKAFGNNQGLVATLGQNPEKFRLLGLSLGNALAACSGCFTALVSGYADLNMGFGQALTGIAMVLIGRQMVIWLKQKSVNDFINIVFLGFGVMTYFVIVNEIIRFGLSPVYLKMAVGGLIIAFLFLASGKQKLRAHI